MRRYNVIEYKSPTDNLSIDDFYKTLGYACLFKGYGTNVNQIPTNELTISIFYEAYPRKMLLTIEMVDLQDPPEFLPQMYDLIKTGEYDCIGTRRVDRTGEAKIKSFLSDQFYHVINKISQTNIVPGARDYRMMTRQMVDAVLSLKEYNRFSKGIFSWVGFKTKYLDYHNVERVAGETDWSTWKLFKYAMDGITDFSQAPLSIAVWLGTSSFVLSIIGLIFVIVRRIVEPGSSVFGWASMICIILLFGGLQLLCIGILGKYIGRIYMQVKQRPIYIIKEKK